MSSVEDGGVPSGSSTVTPWAGLILLAASFLALALLGPTRDAVLQAILPWTVAFLALLHLWRRHPGWLARPGVLLGGALFLRILFLLPVQDLSDDLFRYVWDGWLGVQGIPPYRYTPDDPALGHLQGDILFREMNSPSFHSVYPPLSQLVFLVGGWIHEFAGWPASARAVRIAFVILEFAGLVALFRVLEHRRADLALYAWNPLAIVAVAGSGHSEGALVLAMGVLLWGVKARRPGVAWTGLALGVLSKGVPLLLAPLLWRQLHGGVGFRRTMLGWIPAALVAGALCLPFLRPEDLPRVWSSTELYVRLFEFNAGVYALLHHAAAQLLGLDIRSWLGTALRGLALAGALWIGLRHAAETVTDFVRGSLLVLSLYLVTATTVHPWYLHWILPLVPFTSTGRSAWMWGAWAGLLTYLVYQGFQPAPIAWLFWGGMGLLAMNEERERFLRPLRRLAARRKAAWVAPWVAGTTVLDVGGAEGEVARMLERLDPALRTRVLDPDPGIRVRNGRSSSAHRDPTAWNLRRRIVGDACALPLADGAVDTVLLVFVLHHTPDPDRALAEALRIAGRRVVILESTHEGPLEHRLLAALDRWVNGARGGGGMGRDEAPLHHRPRSEWLDAATRLGARVVVADRPHRSVHRVLRLVLEPGAGAASSRPAGSERAAEAPEELHP